MTLGANNNEINTKLDELFSAILLEQQKYMQLKPADEEKKTLLKNKLEEYEKLRGKGFFFNYFSTGKGHGPFTELIDGSVKYDLITGIGPNLLGHSHPVYIRSVLEAATVDTVMCGNLQTYEQPYELTNNLMKSASKNSRLKHFWFSGSGSFANDVALKILWQKMAPKYSLIAFKKAFAGRSVATQDITHNPAYKEGMPDLVDVKHALHYDQNDPENALQKSLDSLNEIWNAAPDTFCAIMIELVQGEGGFIYGTKEYYEGIFNWAKDKGIYVWVDEVQTFARTHELFAFQMFGLEKYVDIVTIGKVLQACGTIYTEELNPKPGLIAGTFNGSIAELQAGANIVQYLTEGNFYGPKGRMKDIEQKFFNKFEELRNGSCKGKLGYYGGCGTMISFEVGESSKDQSTEYVKKLFENGIISFFAGKDPTRIRFLLPIAITDDHIDEIFKIIEKTTHEVI